MPVPVKMKRADFIDFCTELKSCTFISAVYSGFPSMSKTGNEYPDAMVTYKFTAILKYNYEEAVNMRRKEQGLPKNFVPGPLPWGDYKIVNGQSTVIVEHKGKSYLALMLRKVGPKRYYSQGRRIPASLIEPFLKKKSPVAKSQGLPVDKSVVHKTYDISNLYEVNMKGLKISLY